MITTNFMLPSLAPAAFEIVRHGVANAAPIRSRVQAPTFGILTNWDLSHDLSPSKANNRLDITV